VNFVVGGQPVNGRGTRAPLPVVLAGSAVLVLAVALAAMAVATRVGTSGAGASFQAAPFAGVAAASVVKSQLDSLPTAGSVKLAPALGTTLPADCLPKPSGPPGSPYQLGLVGTVRNGVLTAGTATVADISASFCAVVTLVNGNPPCGATGSVTAPQDGQSFGKLSATLTLIPGMTPGVPFVAHPGQITGGFACAPSTGGLSVTLDAVVSGSTGLFGLSCTVGPLTIPLSGVLTGPLTDATITLKGSNFAVPGVSSSSTCSGEAPSQIDAIAGLPIAAGKASITLPATASLYRPAA
jgi:hypothetical protein